MAPHKAEENSSLLADLIWWLHGYKAARPDCQIGESHIEALRQMRYMLLGISEKAGVYKGDREDVPC